MTPAQRAVIAQAKKDGLPAMEVAAEFICHSMMEVLLHQLRKREIAFNKLGEREQDSAIQDMQTELKKVAQGAARMITSNGCETVAATMKSLKIDGKLTATMVVDGEEPNRHILTDKAHDKSGILIVLYPNSFDTGLSDFQGEKDQRDLPLDDDKAANTKKPRATKAKDEPKPIELPPGLIDQAEEFVRNQQTAKVAAIQNQFKINIDKGQALLSALEERGVVTAADEKGERQLVREKPADATTTGSSESATGTPAESSSDGHHLDTDANGFVIMSDELVALATAKVRKDGKVSKGALAVTYDLDDTVADQLIDRLELEGVISPEDDLGGREVITLQ